MYYIELIIVTILGAILGSFYACIGYRIPNKIKLSKPRSYCEHCKKELKWYMNIPIFAYISLKGRCAYCKTKINPISFIVEILTSLLFALFYIRFGFTTNFYFGIILISVLSITIVSDMLYYYISDRVVIISIILVILIHLLGENIMDVLIHVINGAVMFVLMYLVKLLGDKKFKQESLGGGDIKLMGLIGLTLGIIPAILTLGVASVLGLIFAFIKNRNTKNNIIPFGPFLLTGAIMILYFVNELSDII